jgi:hypothetical protein
MRRRDLIKSAGILLGASIVNSTVVLGQKLRASTYDSCHVEAGYIRLKYTPDASHRLTRDLENRLITPGFEVKEFYRNTDEITGHYPGFIITIGPLVSTGESNYVRMYPYRNWAPLEINLMRLPSAEIRTRKLQRLMVGHATEVPIVSGCFSIPEFFYALLDDKQLDDLLVREVGLGFAVLHRTQREVFEEDLLATAHN